MALPTKGTRRIVVEGARYRWRAVYADCGMDDGYGCPLSLIVEPEERGQRLVARFWGYEMRDGWVIRQSEGVTPGLVRRIMMAALEQGWKPKDRGLGQLTIDGKPFFPDPALPLFSERALAILEGRTFDPAVRGAFDMVSGGLVWPDEFPPPASQAAAVVSPHRKRFLLAFRASLTLDEELLELRLVWEQVVQHAPHWPGLRPDRRGVRARHRLLAAKRRANAWMERMRGLLNPFTSSEHEQPS